QKLYLESGNDGVGDLVLDFDDVGEVAIEAIGPEMVAGLPVDQLGVDPNTASRLSNAALEDMADAKLAGYLLYVGVLALEAEGGVAGDNVERGKFGEVGGDVLAD